MLERGDDHLGGLDELQQLEQDVFHNISILSSASSRLAKRERSLTSIAANLGGREEPH